MPAEQVVVTGALGYTGRYITRRLLARGAQVTTLVAHPDRPNPFGSALRVAPFDFDRPDALRSTLAGATTLYNTYWVRFARGGTTFEQAVANTRRLIQAAQAAGVRRLVHISVSNASAAPHLPYFRGKAELEEAVRRSKLSYAIVRPTLIFGLGDILINNIAWLLRRFPLFAVPGDGRYRLQPIAAEDVAAIAVEAGDALANVELDAAGPDTFTFDELVRLIAGAVSSRARLVHMPPALALAAASLIGMSVGDVMLTRDEVAGLMADTLVSAEPPRGQGRLGDWLRANAETLGREYASELRRHFPT